MIPSSRPNILGRYAYLAFDCTGMMDANLFTNPVQRSVGISVPEISIAYLPEVADLHNDKITSEDDFFTNKANYSRFGTFPEILFLNDGVANASGYSEKLALSLSVVNNLMPYSLCYDAGWWDWSTANWNVSFSNAPININGWINNPTYASNAFYGVGFTPAQAQEMSYCFQDYVDTNDLPSGPAGEPDWNAVSCEAFPMINEISVSNRVNVDVVGTNLIHEVYVNVELWYPFTGVTNTKIYEIALNRSNVVILDLSQQN